MFCRQEELPSVYDFAPADFNFEEGVSRRDSRSRFHSEYFPPNYEEDFSYRFETALEVTKPRCESFVLEEPAHEPRKEEKREVSTSPEAKPKVRRNSRASRPAPRTASKKNSEKILAKEDSSNGDAEPKSGLLCPNELKSKIWKVKNYWRKSSLLTPNVFNLSKSLPEIPDHLLELQDLSRKEVLVTGPNARVAEGSWDEASGESHSEDC